MGKRKAVESSEEESEAQSTGESSAEETVPKAKKMSKVQTIKKPASSRKKSSNDSDEEEEAPKPSKKPKRDATEKGASSSAGPSSSAKIKTNKQGEKYIDLGKKKFATVRTFKGKPLLDIREFWGDDDDLKPGKKGISLNLEQWQALREGIDDLDRLIKEVS
ncbi:hypothetical protein CC1G_01886 [Coprinopsis cinerea okayama7|uniref:Transcriptional coactivator p15 (PC4) C-terminal domain-containing protein n=1 Tax=Coprinopsis cinerea (strain Okayama-7 / 130 / ATCC MYA-4618 / FGSC 9003) TaxID=240176 RepID=A8N5V5_COPC7|nr:hypothetical protein CC1G_01886 [Coprinopsis cinerea okayama7\|eukprot:XP_001830250.1 hypothetical protein CC1G_01886 [Coprinopsis cinerea okayama7\